MAALISLGGLNQADAVEASQQPQPLTTGVSYVRTSDPAGFEHVEAAGARFAHRWLNWASVAPAQRPALWAPEDPADPHYDWQAVDAWVVEAVNAGLEPLLQVHGAPTWAQGCDFPSALPNTPCKTAPAALADFALAAARRYNGYFGGLPRVRYWQALNEPNLSLFFNPQFEEGRLVSPYLYRRLVNSFYAAVKSAHGSNLVLAAGLGPVAVPGSTIGPMRFARGLLCMRGRRQPRPLRGGCEGGVHFDIFDIHPYTTGGPRHRGKADDVQLGDLAKLGDLIAAADRAGRIKGRFRRTPIWITEFSWDSKPPDPGGLAMPVLKRWTAEALFRAWRAGITHFFWYSLRDNPPDRQLSFAETFESGLYFRGATVAEDRPKPHVRAFRFPFVAYSRGDGFYFWGRTPESRSGRVVLQVRRAGRWHRAGVARADRYGIFEGRIAGYGRSRSGTVRAMYRRERAAPFSLRPVRGFYQPPFGRPRP